MKVRDVVRLREKERLPVRSSAGIEKSVWLAFWEAGSTAALITAVIGGIAVGIITHRYQQKEKERDRSLAETKEYLDRERKVVEDAFQTIGALIANCEDLIQLTTPGYDLRGRTAAQKKFIAAKKEEVINNFNSADRNWKSKQEALGLLIAMEHGNERSVVDAWSASAKALDAYDDCALRWFETQLVPVDAVTIRTACAHHREDLNKDLQSLTEAIVASRRLAGQAE